MIRIPIKYKEIKYPKKIGNAIGGLFTKAFLVANESEIKFAHRSFNFFQYLINRLPVVFYNHKYSTSKF